MSRRTRLAFFGVAVAALAVVLAALSSGGSVAFARFLERWLIPAPSAP